MDYEESPNDSNKASRLERSLEQMLLIENDFQ